jgi:hypothetical protein
LTKLFISFRVYFITYICRRLPNDLSRRLEIELTKETDARNHSRTINKTLSRTNSEKGLIKNSNSIETAETGTTTTFQSRLWTALFGNVIRSIDELYRLCEEEGDKEMCLEAENLFERSGRDFKKLTERYTADLNSSKRS